MARTGPGRSAAAQTVARPAPGPPGFLGPSVAHCTSAWVGGHGEPSHQNRGLNQFRCVLHKPVAVGAGQDWGRIWHGALQNMAPKYSSPSGQNVAEAKSGAAPKNRALSRRNVAAAMVRVGMVRWKNLCYCYYYYNNQPWGMGVFIE